MNRKAKLNSEHDTLSEQNSLKNQSLPLPQKLEDIAKTLREENKQI